MSTKTVFALVCLLLSAVLVSCGSAGPATYGVGPESPQNSSGSLVKDIETLVNKADPTSLIAAVKLITDERITTSEFGREMLYVCAQFFKQLYPDVQASIPNADPPLTSVYLKIFQSVEKGALWDQGKSTTNFLYTILPLFILVADATADIGPAGKAMLERAKALGVESVLIPYFSALISEREKNYQGAYDSFKATLAIGSSCYPAEIGIARVLMAMGRSKEAIDTLSSLRLRYPNNLTVKKRLGEALYLAGDYAQAGPLIAQVLLREPDDYRFLLMRAHILIEQKSYSQAGQLLDAYAAYDQNDRLYILLKARYLYEYEKVPAEALDVLKVGLGLYPDDFELLVFAAKLSMELGRATECREFLDKAITIKPDSLELRELMAQQALDTRDYPRALTHIDWLLANRGSVKDLELAFKYATATNNIAKSLKYAKALYDADPANESYILSWISLNIYYGDSNLALSLIDKALAGKGSPKFRSSLYFLKSRLEKTDEAVMNDLRQSLLENPQNFDALTGMYDLYYKAKDYRKAQYYLKQAIALNPDAPGMEERQKQLSMAFPNQ